jgi:molybdopterin-guanine dinucleotide biosynthesis protein A
MNTATASHGIATADITGLVLAGGRGSRMGGVDKGLQRFQGVPLATHAIKRLTLQVGALLVNANRHHDIYQAYDVPVVADLGNGYDGPLAGIQAGLGATHTPWLASVPCDAPLFPLDLVQRLAAAAMASGAQVAVARTTTGRHPVFMLVSTSVSQHLGDFLASGGRRVRQWQDMLDTVEVSFDAGEHAFDNINTLDALHALEQHLGSHSPLS